MQIKNMLPPSIINILDSLNLEVFSFEEIKSIGKSMPIEMRTRLANGYYEEQEDYIAINENHCVDPIAIVLHETIHATGNENRLNRESITKSYANSTQKERETEEVTAQLGMFKLAVYLGFDSNKYADITWSYINSFHQANYIKADRDSDKAVDYIISLAKLEKVA